MLKDITTALFRPPIRGFGLCGPLARFGGDLWRPVSTMQTDCEPPPEDDRLDAAADQAIAACGGIARDAVKALLVANEFLEARVAELQAAASRGYSRGRFEPPPRDRKDWYDLSPRSLTTSHCLSSAPTADLRPASRLSVSIRQQ